MISLFLVALASLDGSTIPAAAQGTWVPVEDRCESQVAQLKITDQTMQWYDSVGYLLLGVSNEVSPPVFYARLQGHNADSEAVFWSSDLVLTIVGSAALRIERIGPAGTKTTSVNYKRCLRVG